MKNKFNSTIMKTMNNFAAQQLSKKQMNEVKGGVYTANCTVFLKDGGNFPASGTSDISKGDAAMNVSVALKPLQDSIDRIVCI